MKSKIEISKSPLKLIILYVFITILVLFTGIRYYFIQKQEIRNSTYSDLSVISELKVNQIINWRKERIGDAYTIFKNNFLISELKAWFDNPNHEKLKNEIINNFSVFCDNYHYKDLIVFDTNGVLKYSYNLKLKALSKIAFSNFNEARKTKSPIFSDIYYCEECGELHLDIIIPLYVKDILLGGIILRINPDDFLFPLIQSWPSSSASSETLLITRDGDDVVYLNELRHRKNTALKLKIKIDSSNINVPAVMAAIGKEGFAEGIDYRGIPVISNVRKIAGSPWFMVAKTDIDEIYTPLREKTVGIGIIVGLILISIGIGFIWVWVNQKKYIQIQQLEDEVQRKALIKHYEYLIKYANDIIILSDKFNKIIDANDSAMNEYGYLKEEMLKLKIQDLFIPETYSITEDMTNNVRLEKGIIYETVHKRKDNSVFPVEVSVHIIDINGKIYYQRIIRNITERKKTEELLRESESVYRNLFTYMVEGYAFCRMIYDGEHPKDFRYLKVNDVFEKLTGLKDVEGKLVTEVIPGIRTSDDKLFEIYNRVALTGKAERFELYVEALKDWYDISVYSPQKEYFVAVFDVITKRKATEEALIESEIKFRSLFENAILGIYRTTPDGKIIDCNPALLNMLGYDTFEELSRRNLELYGFKPGYSRSEFTKKIESEGVILGLESAWIKKDGTSIFVNENAKAIKDEKGKLLFYEGTVEDITERKKMEEELKLSEEKFSKAFNSSPYAITLSNPSDGKIIDVNKGFTDITGYKKSEVIGISSLEIKLWRNKKDRDYVVNELSKGNKIYGKEFIYRKKSGEEAISLYSAEIISINNQDVLISSYSDITDLKKAEENIQSMVQRYHLILSKQFYGTLVVSKENIIEFVNEKFCELFFMKETPSELIGLSANEMLLKIIPSYKDSDATLLLIKDIVEKDQLVFDNEIEMKDGRILLVDFNPIIINGKNAGRVWQHRDITDRKRIEQAVEESENKFRTLFESMNEGVALHELVFNKKGEASDYKILDVNPAYEKHIGISAEKAKNKLATEFYGLTIPPYLDIYSNVAKTGTPYFFETYFPPLNKHFEISVFSPKKNLFATVFTDITERKLSEEALRESERKLREAQEMAHLGYWLWDIKTGEVEWSDEVFKIFRLNPKEFKPQIDSILSLSPWPEENKRDKEIINRAIESHKPGFYEQKFLRPDKSIGYYSSTFQGNYNEKGELLSIVGSVMDITERKIAEEKIQKLNEELELRVLERTVQLQNLNKELESFSYSVSHDLRAPLRSIDGFSLAIFEDYYKILDAKGKEYLERIRKATARMDELIDSMLKLSRVTRFEIKYDKVNLSSIANEITENLIIPDKNRVVEFKIQDNIIANGDTYLLRILLENLLLNAWKFTGKKEKTIIEFGTIINNENIIYFVKDNGTGFDMKYYDKLFGAFQRLHSQKDFPGTGVGLATSQRIVHRHNGKIWAESEINSGTTFYFTLK